MQLKPVNLATSLPAATADGYCLVDVHGAIVAADDAVTDWLRSAGITGTRHWKQLLTPRPESNDRRWRIGVFDPESMDLPAEESFEAVLTVGEYQDESATVTSRRLAGAEGQLWLLAIDLHSSGPPRFFDPLTDLPDRREVAACVAGWRRCDPDTRFALLFVDLDDFKQVNDRYGHLVGDRVLQALSRRWQHGVRDGDLVARYGGDEFVILLRDACDKHEVHLIVERLLRETEAPIQVDAHALTITATVGAAIAAGADQSVNDLIAEADRAMYQAKRRRPR